jgi:hypothetical protein
MPKQEHTDLFYLCTKIKQIFVYIPLTLKIKKINYRGPEIPCLRIIKKCININTAVNNGNTKVCKL